MMSDRMQFLSDWLAGLPDEHAALMWIWLDGDPDAARDMIERVCNTHPLVVAVHGATDDDD